MNSSFDMTASSTEYTTGLNISIGGSEMQLTDYVTDTVNNASMGTDEADLYIATLNHVSENLWIVLSPILVFAGMIGNTLNVVVLSQMSSWHRSTILLMIVLAVTDTTVLCSGLLRYCLSSIFDLDVRLLSNWGCKLNLFVVYLSMQFSSWTRVAITIERYVMTAFPLKYNFIITFPRTMTFLISIFVFLVFVDGHFFWTNGLIKNKTDCGSLNEEFLYFDEFIFTYVDLVMLSLLPFILMLILSIVIVKSLRKAHVRRKSMCGNPTDVSKMREAGAKLTRTLLFITSYFLIATIPISIYFIVESYMAKIIETDKKVKARLGITWSVSYLFQYTIYTVNFYLYVSINEQYRRTFMEIFGCRQARNRPGASFSSIHSSMQMRRDTDLTRKDENNTSTKMETTNSKTEQK